MDILEFYILFRKKYESIKKVVDVLKFYQVFLSRHENSLDFGDLLEKILNCCQTYSNNPEPFRHWSEIENIKFRALVEENYLQLKKFLQK